MLKYLSAREDDDSDDGNAHEKKEENDDEHVVEHPWPTAITNIANSNAADRGIAGVFYLADAADFVGNRISKVCKYFSDGITGVAVSALVSSGLKKRPRKVPPKVEYKLGGKETVQRNDHGIKPGDIHEFYYIQPGKIAEGSSGCIYKGINRATFWTRAVKALSTKHRCDVDAFLHEIHVMKELDHPNVVKLFDTFEDHDYIYIVMEYCAGPELANRIVTEGKFTEKQAAVIMQQLLRTLCYMHAHHFMHRDLKPENIMLFSNGPVETNIVKIIDFGLAVEFEEGEMLTEKCGASYYVSPQVMAARYDKKADMWTAGVLMYILLAGYPPFMGATDIDVLNEVRLGNYFFNVADWRGVSDNAKDVIRRLIRMEVHERMTAEECLAHPWINDWVPRLTRVPLQNTIIGSLREFKSYNFLRKESLEIIANHLTDIQLQAQRDSFNALDFEGDGTLGFEEFRSGLLRSGLKTIPDDLKDILDELDSDGSGKVEFTEFLAATVDKKYLDEEVIWSAFRYFDANGDGKISQKEVFQVVNGRIDDPKDFVTVEEVVVLFQALDESDDGFVDFAEFFTMMKAKDNAEARQLHAAIGFARQQSMERLESSAVEEGDDENAPALIGKPGGGMVF